MKPLIGVFFCLIILTSIQAEILQQEVVFDQCSCRDGGEFTSTGDILLTGTFQQINEDCGELADNGFPIEAGLRGSLETLTLSESISSGDWGIMFGFENQPNSTTNLATIVSEAGVTNFTIDEDELGSFATISETSLRRSLVAAETDGYQIFFGFTRTNRPTSCQKQTEFLSSCSFLSDTSSKPTGELEVIISSDLRDLITNIIVIASSDEINSIDINDALSDPSVFKESLPVPITKELILSGTTSFNLNSVFAANVSTDLTFTALNDGTLDFTVVDDDISFSIDYGFTNSECRNSFDVVIRNSEEEDNDEDAEENNDDEENESQTLIAAVVGTSSGLFVGLILGYFVLTQIRQRRRGTFEEPNEKQLETSKDKI